MRPSTLVTATGMATAIASLSCATPALADTVAPSQGAVTGVAVLIAGLVVVVVVVAAALVLRSLTRARRAGHMRCASCGAQMTAGAPYCPSCGAPQAAGPDDPAESGPAAVPDDAARADKPTEEDEPT